MSNAGNNKLIKNDDARVIFDTLNEAKQNEEKIMAWKVVGPSKITAELSISIVKKYDKKLVLSYDLPQESKIQNILSGSDSINLFLLDRQVLFQSEVVESSKKGELIVRFPQMLAQAERRKSLRLVLKNESVIKVDFFKSIVQQRVHTQHFNKGCFDISKGGLSFIVSKMEEKFFSVGDELTDIDVNIDGTSHNITAKIVNLIPVEPNKQNKLIYKGHRVCLQFTKVNDDTIDHINRFVFENIELDQAV